MSRRIRLSCLVAVLVGAGSIPGQRTREDASLENSWADYGGGADSAQYSDLSQINRENVQGLRVVWRYSTGDSREYLFNPIVVHGVMYVLAKRNSIVALDAKTGKELWVHETDPNTTLITHRGVNYWESPDGRQRRLLFACNNILQAIDARTGKRIADFGRDGGVDLRAGLGRDPKTLTLVQSTTPGKIFGNLLILGSATNEEYTSGPGDIRAYDVRDGKLVWAFHTIPHPGEFGYDTWPPGAWKTVGGANAWSELTLDTSQGIVFVPTASPKYNFYGADRTGANLFGNCLLALDARTGRRLWHFQMVHHDIWDYDNATAPKLLTVIHDGVKVQVVVQVNKEGFVWVFERDTGKPLWPIEERPVPKSDMPGEVTSPTQPFPLQPPPFARQAFNAQDLNPYIADPNERAQLLTAIRNARNEGIFTPPDTRDTIEMPGNNGGANFGGAAVDPRRGKLYVVSKDLPAMLKLQLSELSQPGAGTSPEGKGRAVYATNCQLCHGADRKGHPPGTPSLVDIAGELNVDQIKSTVRHGKGQMPAFPQLREEEVSNLVSYLQHPDAGTTSDARADAATDGRPPGAPSELHYKTPFGFLFISSGLPAISPPWTTLTAYDLNTGTIEWQAPLGEVPELAARGIHNTGSQFPKVGPVVTAGGLLFAGTRDRKFRALDTRTGKELWEFELSAGIEGMPAVYQLEGHEYIAVCASARSATQTHAVAGRPASTAPIHGEYVVFGLE
ncbi:MAG TPA: PQQ-binding-like beta-propeller repeat protein [Bryobacteraceae bacterium]|nr:PQQ-binding-like beta-propeller repeat protein [Bryobacteraceae bacterium]